EVGVDRGPLVRVQVVAQPVRVNGDLDTHGERVGRLRLPGLEVADDDAAVGEADQLVERPGRLHLVVDDELFGADDGDPCPADRLAVGVEAGRDVGGHVLRLAAVGDGFDEGVDAGPGGRGGGRAGGFGGFGAHLVQLAFDGPVVGGAVGERAGDAGHQVGAAEQPDGGHALP